MKALVKRRLIQALICVLKSKIEQLPEIKEFNQTIKEILAYALDDDRALAEARFATLQKLVNRLGSQETEQKRWRECVLDVRHTWNLLRVKSIPKALKWKYIEWSQANPADNDKS